MDDNDDGPRPGKRSCTMKTTISPQPSPTLIECPEPGCDKKYKHINGLRYHQAHAHLEEVRKIVKLLSTLLIVRLAVSTSCLQCEPVSLRCSLQ